jgi:hypothetical protein
MDTTEPMSAIAEIAVGNKARNLNVALSPDLLASCELMSKSLRYRLRYKLSSELS